MAFSGQRHSYQSQPTLAASLPSLLASTSALHHDHTNDPLPISATHGVIGPDKVFVAQELRRLTGAKVSSKKRTAAGIAGVFTLIVGAFTTWYLVEAVLALLRSSINLHFSQWLFALIETILNAVSILLILTTIPWIRRSRKPTTLSKVIVRLSFTVFILQVAIVAMNGVLIYLWRDTLSTYCTTWAVDVVWQADVEACPVATNDLDGWWIAFGVRLACTLIIGSLWMVSLHRFNTSLSRFHDAQNTIEDGFLQSEEVQTILARYAAKITLLPAGFDPKHQQTQSEHDLPPMPEIRRLLSEDEEESVARYEEKEDTEPGWISSLLGWMFGVSTTSQRNSAKDEDSPEAGEMRQTNTDTFRLLRSDITPPTSRFANNPLHPDYDGMPSLNAFGGHRRNESREVLLPSDQRPLPPIPQEQEASCHESAEWQEYDSMSSEEEMESIAARHTSHQAPVEDEPKPTVYVRMGSGHLVHRLSTVYSISSHSNRASIDSASLLSSAAHAANGNPLYMSGAWRGSSGSENLRL